LRLPSRRESRRARRAGRVRWFRFRGFGIEAAIVVRCHAWRRMQGASGLERVDVFDGLLVPLMAAGRFRALCFVHRTDGHAVALL